MTFSKVITYYKMFVWPYSYHWDYTPNGTTDYQVMYWLRIGPMVSTGPSNQEEGV